MLEERFAGGLLEPFQCAGCGRLYFDPLGWTDARQPLCGQCADPVGYPEQAELRPNLSTLREGTIAELSHFAVARHICIEALETAQRMGTARVGRICGFPSIVLLDQSGRCAEGRRLDNKKYPSIGSLKRRKSHTLAHSKKNWPVGILPASEYCNKLNIIVLVEGLPDFFSALHFAQLQKRADIQPVAILGRVQATHGFHPDSLELFRGRRVRVYPHADSDGGGLEQAIRWARQLERINCEVDLFRLDGLKKADGSPIKDLNDCVEIAPDQAHELEALLP